MVVKPFAKCASYKMLLGEMKFAFSVVPSHFIVYAPAVEQVWDRVVLCVPSPQSTKEALMFRVIVAAARSLIKSKCLPEVVVQILLRRKLSHTSFSTRRKFGVGEKGKGEVAFCRYLYRPSQPKNVVWPSTSKRVSPPIERIRGENSSISNYFCRFNFSLIAAAMLERNSSFIL